MFELNSLSVQVVQCSQLLYLRPHPGEAELGYNRSPHSSKGGVLENPGLVGNDCGLGPVPKAESPGGPQGVGVPQSDRLLRAEGTPSLGLVTQVGDLASPMLGRKKANSIPRGWQAQMLSDCVNKACGGWLMQSPHKAMEFNTVSQLAGSTITTRFQVRNRSREAR